MKTKGTQTTRAGTEAFAGHPNHISPATDAYAAALLLRHDAASLRHRLREHIGS